MEIIHVHKTKTMIAFESIKESIISGEYRPGSKLIIREISSDLGISDIPVREAFKQLEAEGLIDWRPHIGAVVTKPSIEQLSEDIFIRSILEPVAARLSAPEFNDSEIEEMEGLLEQMEKSIEVQRYDLVSTLDREFHRLLYSKSKNKKLLKIIQQLWEDSERAKVIFKLKPDSIISSLNEHKLMIEAIKRKDYNGLADIVQKQKRRIEEIIIELLDDFTEEPLS